LSKAFFIEKGWRWHLKRTYFWAFAEISCKLGEKKKPFRGNQDFSITFALPYKLVDMPKMKTHSRAKKTFKVTGSGKVKRFKAFKSHLLNKKATKRKRHLRGSTLVNGANAKSVNRMLCQG
jgi:large subunit ribosomal protein L35